MFHKLTRKRAGFTIIEALVVCSIVAISLSLALPSLVESRQAAQRDKCKNNLKQIGLALHNYHDVYLGFSPGWIVRGKDVEGKHSNGWQTGLLPYIGQANLYNKIDSTNFEVVFPNGSQNLALQTMLKTSVPAYHCPSDPAGAVNTLRGGLGRSNYSGNYGSKPIGRWADLDYLPGQAASPNGARVRSNGLFWGNSFRRIRDITDGTSNTLMVGEKSVIGRSGLWMGVRSNFHESDAVSDTSWASGLNLSDTGFSSRHPGGVQFVLCDGSVRFISEKVASSPQGSIFQALGTCNGGEVIGEY